ncbi:hypothetical protein NLJ89_g7829 [Agrocybe chaxingu]|uniref:Uncharacterized protein n=1 Tax=Agrocybe chaxingu TaxID=84603 RepID=A0A9W8JWE3_9AGAR|nr:hypothetical protein NLJ89_g7829 [Agrocybe chaxingu]
MSKPVTANPWQSPPSDYPIERSAYYGDFASNILVGIDIWLFAYSAYFLNRGAYSRTRRRLLIGYSFILLLLLVAASLSRLRVGMLMWIDHRYFVPGGPRGYLRESPPWNLLGIVAVMVADVWSNLLMIYRCYVVLSQKMAWVITLPLALLITSTAFAVLTIIEGVRPGATFFDGKSLAFGLFWVSFTVSFNVVVTLLICGRLLSSYLILRRIGGHALAKERLGVIAILVESALPFSVFGVVLLVLYGVKSPIATAFADVWGVIVGLSPQLIILRVAMGRAVTKETLMTTSVDVSSCFLVEITDNALEANA